MAVVWLDKKSWRDRFGLPKRFMALSAFFDRMKEIENQPIPQPIVSIVEVVLRRVMTEHNDFMDNRHEIIGVRAMKALRNFNFHHHLNERECLAWYHAYPEAFDELFSRHYTRDDLNEREHIEYWDKRAKLVEVVILGLIGSVVFDSWVYGRSSR